jgi:hypothetical protein
MRLYGPDRDQRKRLGWAAPCQQLLQVPQCLAQVFDAEQLPSNELGALGAERDLHGRVSKKFEHSGM